MFPGLESFFRFFNRFDKRYKFWDEIDSHIRSIIKKRRNNQDVCMVQIITIRPIRLCLVNFRKFCNTDFQEGRYLKFMLIDDPPEKPDVLVPLSERPHTTFDFFIY